MQLRKYAKRLNVGSGVCFLLIPKSTTDTMTMILSEFQEVWCDECDFKRQFDADNFEDAHDKLEIFTSVGCPRCGAK